MARYVGDLLLVARASSPDFLQLDLVDLGALVDGALVRASALAPRDWARASTPTPASCSYWPTVNG